MKYKLLGDTGLKVSTLCLGTMQYGGKGFFRVMGDLQQVDVDEQFKSAVEAGINFIDTANVYSEGLSEELVGQAIQNLGLTRDDLVLATKVRGGMGKGPNDRGLSRKHVMQQIEASLRRLKTDYIDLYQIHSLDPHSNRRNASNIGRPRAQRQSSLHRSQQRRRLAIDESAGVFKVSADRKICVLAGELLARHPRA